MSSVSEIEDAIAKLPAPQVNELADWLEKFREQRVTSPAVAGWLQRARGAARAGETTANIMALTRGE